jgi:hypothetical protein
VRTHARVRITKKDLQQGHGSPGLSQISSYNGWTKLSRLQEETEVEGKIQKEIKGSRGWI